MKQQSNTASLSIFRIIAGALMVSQILYLFVLNLVLRPMEGDEPFSPQWIPNFNDNFELAAVAYGILATFIAINVPPLLTKKMRPTALDQNSSNPEEVQSSELLPATVFVPFLIRYAFLESICLVGFTIAFMKHMPNLILPFFAVSFALMLRYFPTSSKKVKINLGFRF